MRPPVDAHGENCVKVLMKMVMNVLLKVLQSVDFKLFDGF